MKISWLDDMIAAVPADYTAGFPSKRLNETVLGPIPDGVLELHRANEFARTQSDSQMKEHHEKQNRGEHDVDECTRLLDARESLQRRAQILMGLVEESVRSHLNIKGAFAIRTEGIVSIEAEDQELPRVQVIEGRGLGDLAAVLAGLSGAPRTSSRRNTKPH